MRAPLCAVTRRQCAQCRHAHQGRSRQAARRACAVMQQREEDMYRARLAWRQRGRQTDRRERQGEAASCTAGSPKRAGGPPTGAPFEYPSLQSCRPQHSCVTHRKSRPPGLHRAARHGNSGHVRRAQPTEPEQEPSTDKPSTQTCSDSSTCSRAPYHARRGLEACAAVASPCPSSFPSPSSDQGAGPASAQQNAIQG